MILSSAFLSRSTACAFKVTRQNVYKPKAVQLWQTVGRMTDRSKSYHADTQITRDLTTCQPAFQGNFNRIFAKLIRSA